MEDKTSSVNEQLGVETLNGEGGNRVGKGGEIGGRASKSGGIGDGD